MPLWAARLGYAGLLPFVFLAVAAWLAPLALRAPAAQALLAYGATIASFLGAIHWGLAMREPMVEQPQFNANANVRTNTNATAKPGQWLWGVFPSLIAWLALLLPLAQGLLTLTLLLVTCLAVDRRSYPRFGLQVWLAMRLRLTLVASVCLLAVSVTV